MKKDFKLYNLIFPAFLLLNLTPMALGITILGNFIIDSVLMIVISLIIYGRVDKTFFLHNVFVAYGVGLFSDIVGSVFCLIYFSRARGSLSGDIRWLIFIGIAISSALILFFDYFMTFSRSNLTKKQQFFSALAFAVLTAPYTFLLDDSIIPLIPVT